MQKFTKRINKRLGSLLIEQGIISKKQLEKALEMQKQEGGLIGEIIVGLGFAKEEDIVYTLSIQYGLPYIPLENYEISDALTKIIPKHVARQYCAIPIDKMGDTLTVVMANPLNAQAMEDLEYVSKCQIQVFVASVSDIRKAIEKLYP